MLSSLGVSWILFDPHDHLVARHSDVFVNLFGYKVYLAAIAVLDDPQLECDALFADERLIHNWGIQCRMSRKIGGYACACEAQVVLGIPIDLTRAGIGQVDADSRSARKR